MSADTARGWGWVAHLREGGTTPWRDWSGTGTPDGLFLPGAQQLELLRRLNAAAGVPSPHAARILAASAPGRGRPDLELVGAASDSAFGPRPIDPADLPADELIRVATSVLADDLVAAGMPDPEPERLLRPTGRAVARPRFWPRRRIYRLLGDPWLADPIRSELIRRGRPPGGPGATVLVLAGPVDQMLADVFAARVFDNSVPRWSPWLSGLRATGRLAPRVDLARIAHDWSGRPGTKVRVVTDLDRLPALVGVRSLDTPGRLPAAALELARRLGAVLGLLTLGEDRVALMRQTLLPRLRELATGPGLVVPHRHRGWVRDQARVQQAALRRGDYPVEGRLDDLLPEFDRSGAPAVGAPADDDVLALAIELLRKGVR